MSLPLLNPKKLLKYLWFGFGLAGATITFNNYFPDFIPNLRKSNLVQQTQTEITQSSAFSIADLKTMDPQAAGQVLGAVVKQEITKIIEVAGQEVKEFPARQVKKIKIGACEELLEEDICSVAQELECSPSD
ncbi:hypothetical protein ACFL18_01245 [Patescibacteria group bacterium]